MDHIRDDEYDDPSATENADKPSSPSILWFAAHSFLGIMALVAHVLYRDANISGARTFLISSIILGNYFSGWL